MTYKKMWVNKTSFTSVCFIQLFESARSGAIYCATTISPLLNKMEQACLIIVQEALATAQEALAMAQEALATAQEALATAEEVLATAQEALATAEEPFSLIFFNSSLFPVTIQTSFLGGWLKGSDYFWPCKQRPISSPKNRFLERLYFFDTPIIGGFEYVPSKY